MHHSAIGDIRAYILTIQCTNDLMKIKVAANSIKRAAEEIKKAAEELEGGEKDNARTRSNSC